MAELLAVHLLKFPFKTFLYHLFLDSSVCSPFCNVLLYISFPLCYAEKQAPDFFHRQIIIHCISINLII